MIRAIVSMRVAYKVSADHLSKCSSTRPLQHGLHTAHALTAISLTHPCDRANNMLENIFLTEPRILGLAWYLSV